jgi:hypothetical protein
MEVNKESVFDCIRRPIRLFMRKPENNHASNDDKGKETIRQVGNPNKEPVAEAMNRKNFFAVLSVMNQSITKEQVSVGFYSFKYIVLLHVCIIG